MSTTETFANIVNRSPLNHSTAKMMYSFPKTQRFNYGLGKNSSQTFQYNLPEMRNFRGTSIGFGKKSDFTKTNDINKVPFYDNKRGFDSNNSKSPAYSMGISRHFFEKVIQPNKGIPERNNPGPGMYNTLKSFGDEAQKISINPLKTEKSSKGFITPGPGEYLNVDMSIGQKYTVSSFRNTVTNVWGHSKEKRFRPAFKIVSPGPGTYSTKSLIDGSGSVYFSNFKSSTSKTITGRYKDFMNKNPTPGPGAYNTTFTEFGGLHDYNKTKSFDGRAIKTYNDTVKRTNFNITNTNENNNLYSTGFKHDFVDFNKITNEIRKHVQDEEKEKKITISHKGSKSDQNLENINPALKTKTSGNRFSSENVTKKTASDHNLTEKSHNTNKNNNNSYDNNEHAYNNENNYNRNSNNSLNNISRNQSENNFERFRSLEKSAVSHKNSVKEFDKHSKISVTNKSVNSKSNSRYAAENLSRSKNSFNHENNNERNLEECSDNEFSRLSEQKKESEKGNKSNLDNNEGKNYGEFANEAKRESASNSRFFVNEKEYEDKDKDKSKNESNYKEELE